MQHMKLKEFWVKLKVSDNIELYVILILNVLSLIMSVIGGTNQQLIQALLATTLALLAVSLLRNRTQNEDIQKLVRELGSHLSLSEMFFKPEDDINEIIQAVRSSQKSYFWGATLFMHIPMLREELAKAIDMGKEIRFLLIKPGGNALSMAAFRAKGSNSKDIDCRAKLGQDLQNSLDTLGDISHIASQNFTKGKLEIRVIDYLAPYTLYVFDVDQPTGWAQSRLSSLHGVHTNRPTYRLTKKKDAVWYDYHVEQFEIAWKLADPWL